MEQWMNGKTYETNKMIVYLEIHIEAQIRQLKYSGLVYEWMLRKKEF